jgi:hypothetical protein
MGSLTRGHKPTKFRKVVCLCPQFFSQFTEQRHLKSYIKQYEVLMRG